MNKIAQKCPPPLRKRIVGKGAQNFLGKLYCKMELIAVTKMSEIGCSISCIAFRSTIFADTRSVRSIKSFLQTSHFCTVRSLTSQRLSLYDTLQHCRWHFQLVCLLHLTFLLSACVRVQSPFLAAPNYIQYRHYTLLFCFGVECSHTKPFLQFVKCSKCYKVEV